MEKYRINKIKITSWISIIGNAFLAILKIVIGFFSNSLAVIGDGIDSSSDIIISIMTLFTAIIISKPPDKGHPYGHFRAETIATTILAFIMFIVGFELFKSSINHLINPSILKIPSQIAIYVTGISIAGKITLAFFLIKSGKQIGSNMLIANGKNMQNDVLISSGVLIGLLFAIIFKISFLDSILAILISLWIMFSAIKIFFEVNNELMDGIKDQSIYNSIFKAVNQTNKAINPHRTRVRKLSSLYVIDMDIEVDGNLSINEAHDIAKEVEKNIKKKIENVYDIIIHTEPKGNVEKKEKYGISGKDINTGTE